jgi:hypothetical protein
LAKALEKPYPDPLADWLPGCDAETKCGQKGAVTHNASPQRQGFGFNQEQLKIFLSCSSMSQMEICG